VKTLERVAKAVETFLPGTRKVGISVRRVERGEIGARLVTVDSKEDATRRKGLVLLDTARNCAEKLHLSEWGATFATSTVKTLLSAESQVHNRPASSVELHELGSADTLVDILGVANLAEELGLAKSEWVSTTIAVGSGSSHFSGREYPNPPPAAMEILRKHRFPIRPGPVERELTTPTGAAITVNLASQGIDSYPAIRPESVGYGAGSWEIKEVANIVRLIVGTPLSTGHHHDQVVVLETNLDDVTGEVIGHAMERVMEAGARDVTVTPVFMKKNRPGHLMSVIADAQSAEELTGVIIKETGTLGVREIPVSRHITLRNERKDWVEVKGKRHRFTVKVSSDDRGRVLKEKVEYEDRKKLSRKTGLGIAEVSKLLEREPKREKTRV
jgi:pyridinium-3,5-bisthiocarboxylic acid mononucleotide nickel chelatase